MGETRVLTTKMHGRLCAVFKLGTSRPYRKWHSSKTLFLVCCIENDEWESAQWRSICCRREYRRGGGGELKCFNNYIILTIKPYRRRKWNENEVWNMMSGSGKGTILVVVRKVLFVHSLSRCAILSMFFPYLVANIVLGSGLCSCVDRCCMRFFSPFHVSLRGTKQWLFWQ